MKLRLLLMLALVIGAALLPRGAAAQSMVDASGVAVNPMTNRIYLVNGLWLGVWVIGGATNMVVATLPLETWPNGVAVNPTTNRIYVTSRAGTVLVIDGGTNTVIATVPVGWSPVGVAVNPDTNLIYVVNKHSDNVSVIDGASNTVMVAVPVGQAPLHLAVNPTTNRIYVANAGSNDVSVIDGAANALAATVPGADGPYGVGANPATNRVYVANYNNNTVSVIEDSAPAPTPTATPTAKPMPPPAATEEVALQGGVCNPVATTYPDNTPIATIAGAVSPSGVLQTLWEFEGGVWQGWSAAFPQASDLTETGFLDGVFICVGGSGPGAATFTRPVP